MKQKRREFWVGCPKCGFVFNSQYARLVALLRKPKAGGWSVTDLNKALRDGVNAVTRARVELLERQGFVKTRIVVARHKRRVVELAKRIRKPNSVVAVEGKEKAA